MNKIAKNRVLYVWDFDNTLAITGGYVRVMHVDGTVDSLTSSEYGYYEHQPGDTFDFSDFDDNLIDPREIKWTTSILRQVVIDHGVDSAMVLTARNAAKPVELFLRLFNLPAIRVVALGDNNPALKSNWLLAEAQKEVHDVIEFFDDNINNIRAVEQISDRVPGVIIIARHVKD